MKSRDVLIYMKRLFYSVEDSPFFDLKKLIAEYMLVYDSYAYRFLVDSLGNISRKYNIIEEDREPTDMILVKNPYLFIDHVMREIMANTICKSLSPEEFMKSMAISKNMLTVQTFNVMLGLIFEEDVILFSYLNRGSGDINEFQTTTNSNNTNS